MAKNNGKSVKMILPPALGSYANLFTPRAVEEGQEPKYSLCLLWPKKDAPETAPSKPARELWNERERQVGLSALIKAIDEVAISKFGPNYKQDKKLKMPLHDGDVDQSDKSEYAGCVYINANASKDRQPGIVDIKLQPVFEEKEAFSGCFYRASVSVFAYEGATYRGVGIGLNNVQVVKKGPRIDGRADAAKEFGEFAEAGDAGGAAAGTKGSDADIGDIV